MIRYIKGTVEALLEDSILLDNQGIGYRIYTSGQSLQSLKISDEWIKLYTHFHVREDEMSLYGFREQEELQMFERLICVNGIGPKAALSILSVLTVKELAFAIMSGDTKTITKANGVGAKGAARIVMELKDKMDLESFLDVESDLVSSDTKDSGNSDNIQDTVLALVSLGYSDMEALRAVKMIPDASDMEAEQLLKAALKKLM